MPPLRRTAAIVLALFAIMALAAPALAKGPGGNSDAAAACDNGGYLDWTRADGSGFKNEGDCTRYAARGATLVAVPITVTYTAVEGSTNFTATVSWPGIDTWANLQFRWVYYADNQFVLGLLAGFYPGSGQHTVRLECFRSGQPITSVTATGTPLGGAQTTYQLRLPADVCGYE